MNTQTTTAKNYLYDLLKKKYHTSEAVRTQIAEIKGKIREDAIKEPLKSFAVKFQGQVINSSFEKTLKIISKSLFVKGGIDTILAFKEHDYVEANMTATLTEVESLIQYLMKPRIVLHCKKGIVKGASNLLIIDETEKSQLDSFTPDYMNRNYVTYAQSREKYTGRLGDYLIFNGLPLTSEKIGRELRFNKIETKNRVFTTTGLKEIFLNLYFVSLVLKLDLEQHYLKLRIVNLQEDELKMVEEKVDDLGFFADIFNHIASKDNPLLSNEDLFLDLMRLEHIIENDNWKAIPAYAGYVYSAANRLNGQFKLLEEYGLFLTYANCIEKFIAKLSKKLFKHKSDIRSEQHNLTANYNELKKLPAVLNHPTLQNDCQEILNSFSKLLAYLDFLTIRDTRSEDAVGSKDAIDLSGKPLKGFGRVIKKCIESIFSVAINISTKSPFRHDQMLKTEQEDDVQKLIMKFSEILEKVSKLKTVEGKDAFLEARRCVPQLTNLSDILDQLKNLIKNIESKKDIQEPFKSIFVKANKFEILYRELSNLGILKTEQDHESVRGILTNIQKLLFDKPLEENKYPEIINKICALEDFIRNKNADHSSIKELEQNPIFKTIVDIKIGIQKIIEIESQNQKIDTFKNDAEFFSYSAKDLNGFIGEIVKFHEELKNTCYYKNTSAFETTEKEFDRLIEEAKGIDGHISLHTRSKDKIVSKEPDVHINYFKSSQLNKKNLEKSIFLLQNQITQIEGFMHDIENNLRRHSFIHSGVATSVLFDQITYLLSNIDVRLIDLDESTESMFKEGVDTIFHYQVGEAFKEPQKEDINDLMKEIDKRMIIREYQISEKVLPNLHLS